MQTLWASKDSSFGDNETDLWSNKPVGGPRVYVAPPETDQLLAYSWTDAEFRIMFGVEPPRPGGLIRMEVQAVVVERIDFAETVGGSK